MSFAKVRTSPPGWNSARFVDIREIERQNANPIVRPSSAAFKENPRGRKQAFGTENSASKRHSRRINTPFIS